MEVKSQIATLVVLSSPLTFPSSVSETLLPTQTMTTGTSNTLSDTKFYVALAASIVCSSIFGALAVCIFTLCRPWSPKGVPRNYKKITRQNSNVDSNEVTE